MARNTPKSKRTRERILEVALPIFANNGYAGSSIRTIANAAEVNVASVAYHFMDKEGLYETVVNRLYEDLSQGVAQIELGKALDESLGWAWDFARSHRDHIRLMMRHYLDHQQRPTVVTEKWAGPLLQLGEGVVLSLQPSWTASQSRLFLLSMQHLIARFAIEDPEDLRRLLGDVEDLDGAVLSYFEALFKKELGLES